MGHAIDDMFYGLLAVLGLMVLCAVVFVCRARSVRETPDTVRQSAIEAGVAEWRVDPKTGETEFVWIKCQEVGL